MPIKCENTLCNHNSESFCAVGFPLSINGVGECDYKTTSDIDSAILREDFKHERDLTAELERCKDELGQLRKGVCIYAREEMENYIFETDQEVIDWFIEWGNED